MKDTHKRTHIVGIVSFFLLLMVFGVISLWTNGSGVSMEEGRTLKPMPKFSWSTLWDGTYTRDLEGHYADTFPLRERFLNASGFWDRLLVINTGEFVIQGGFDLGDGENLGEILDAQKGGQTSPAPPQEPSSPAPSQELSASTPPEPSPISSQEPPASSSPATSQEPSPTPPPKLPNQADVDINNSLIVGDRIMHVPTMKPNNFPKYAGVIRGFAQGYPDTRVISMIVPNSAPFYAPEQYLTPETDQRAMIETVNEMMGSSVVTVNAYDRIAAHTDEYIYFRADHHWTARGAYWAYTAFCDTLGLTPVELSNFETGQYEDFLGSFYRNMKMYPQSDAVRDNPDTVEYFYPIVAHSAESFKTADMTNGESLPVVNTNLPSGVANKYICFTNGDQALIRVRTEAGTGRSILVVKESYANAMVPFLTTHYDEIFVVDFRRFNNNEDLPKLNITDFVSEHGVDDVLFLSYPYLPSSMDIIHMLGRLTGQTMSGTVNPSFG